MENVTFLREILNYYGYKFSESDLVEITTRPKYIMGTKAIGLIRVSTDKQDLDQQSEVVKRTMMNDGFKEEDIILIQDAESGSQLNEEERSGLNKLKKTIESEQISSVYCYELSRISRQTKIVFSIRDYLVSRNINLICINPYFKLIKDDGTISETSSMVFGVFATLAEQENYLRIKRVKRGIAKKKSEGKVMGRKMIFGYDRVKGEPVVNEKQAIIVREIFDRFQSGESCGVIGYDMYLRGVFGSDLRRCSAVSRVSVLLADERYCGKWPFPAIVSKAQFDKCRSIINSHSKDFARTNYTDKDYYCAGVLYTDRGYAMCPSYGNRRYQYRDPDKVHSLNVNMNILDNLTLYALRRYLESGVNEAERQSEIEEVRDKLNKNKERESEIKKKIVLLNEENEMIENRIIKKRIAESKGDAMIDDNISQIRKLEGSLDDILYENGLFNNRLIYLTSFLYESSEDNVIPDTPNEIKANIKKYITKIIVSRLGFGRFNIKYVFRDNTEKEYGFYSIVHKCQYFDSQGQEIHLEMNKK